MQIYISIEFRHITPEIASGPSPHKQKTYYNILLKGNQSLTISFLDPWRSIFMCLALGLLLIASLILLTPDADTFL